MLVKIFSVSLVLVALFHSTFQGEYRCEFSHAFCQWFNILLQTTALMVSPCPRGQVYNCFVDPCQVSTCPNFPSATCRADYCGGCFARWYLYGQEVTNLCGSNVGIGKTCHYLYLWNQHEMGTALLRNSQYHHLCYSSLWDRGQVYMSCGSACPPTCANPTPFCTEQCVPGCQCPLGTVLDYSRCVTKDMCGERMLLMADMCAVSYSTLD